MTKVDRLRATGYGLQTRGRKALYAALLPVLALLAQPVLAKDDFLAPQQAYKYSTRVDGDQLIVTWQIEPGYYLYKKRLGVASAAPTAQLGQPAWPKGENHHDEYFGDQEIYRGKVEVPVPMSFPGAKPAEQPIELKLQGCAD